MELTPAHVGTFEYKCTIPGHGDRHSTLRGIAGPTFPRLLHRTTQSHPALLTRKASVQQVRHSFAVDPPTHILVVKILLSMPPVNHFLTLSVGGGELAT